MATFQAKAIGVPSIQRDGKAVILALDRDDDTTLTIRIPGDDLRAVTKGFLDAIDAMEVSEAIWDSTRDDGGEVKAMPTVYQAAHFRFVSDPNSDFQCLSVLDETGQEVLIGFRSHQIPELLARIQAAQGIQVSDGPAS